MPFVVVAFYHFFDFAHFAKMRAPLLAFMQARNIKGSILIAEEGINGTVAGSREALDALIDYLKIDIIGAEFSYKESYAEEPPFPRTKVRLKKETISLGAPADATRVGTYIEPKDWNNFIERDDVLLLDSRNKYETHLGVFKGAIDPDTQNFKELPDFINKSLDDKKKMKIATYCTGGIRCEKLTAWMLDQGYEEVYHLKGGILKYLEEIPQEQSTWEGECFVFDKRIAVGHGLVPSSTASMCRCGHCLTPQDRAHPAYEENVVCGYCAK